MSRLYVEDLFFSRFIQCPAGASHQEKGDGGSGTILHRCKGATVYSLSPRKDFSPLCRCGRALRAAWSSAPVDTETLSFPEQRKGFLPRSPAPQTLIGLWPCLPAISADPASTLWEVLLVTRRPLRNTRVENQVWDRTYVAWELQEEDKFSQGSSLCPGALLRRLGPPVPTALFSS